jgi:hypothetical protein
VGKYLDFGVLGWESDKVVVLSYGACGSCEIMEMLHLCFSKASFILCNKRKFTESEVVVLSIVVFVVAV